MNDKFRKDFDNDMRDGLDQHPERASGTGARGNARKGKVELIRIDVSGKPGQMRPPRTDDASFIERNYFEKNEGALPQMVQTSQRQGKALGNVEVSAPGEIQDMGSPRGHGKAAGEVDERMAFKKAMREIEERHGGRIIGSGKGAKKKEADLRPMSGDMTDPFGKSEDSLGKAGDVRDRDQRRHARWDEENWESLEATRHGRRSPQAGEHDASSDDLTKAQGDAKFEEIGRTPVDAEAGKASGSDADGSYDKESSDKSTGFSLYRSSKSNKPESVLIEEFGEKGEIGGDQDGEDGESLDEGSRRDGASSGKTDKASQEHVDDEAESSEIAQSVGVLPEDADKDVRDLADELFGHKDGKDAKKGASEYDSESASESDSDSDSDSDSEFESDADSQDDDKPRKKGKNGKKGKAKDKEKSKDKAKDKLSKKSKKDSNVHPSHPERMEEDESEEDEESVWGRLNDTDEYEHDVLKGFRLTAMQFYNWGSFDGEVSSIRPNGNNMLVTGNKGAGRIQIVDAVNTLLQKPGSFPYTRDENFPGVERSLRSYIQGWQLTPEYEEGGSIPMKLREGTGHVTVILATFVNEGNRIAREREETILQGRQGEGASEASEWFEGDSSTGGESAAEDALKAENLNQGAKRKDERDGTRVLTLCQVLWLSEIDETPERFYVVSSKPFDIRREIQDFSNDPQLLRNKLRHRGHFVFESYEEYRNKFMLELGVPSEDALRLLARFSALKGIANLTDFVRERILDESDLLGRHEAIIASLDELESARATYVGARDELDALAPMIRLNGKRSLLLADLAELKSSRDDTRHLVAQRKSELCREKIADLQVLVDNLKDVERVENENLQALRLSHHELLGILALDDGLKAADVRAKIEKDKVDLSLKEESRERLREILSLFLWKEPQSAMEFAALKTKGRKEREELEARALVIMDKVSSKRAEIQGLHEKKDYYQDEVVSLGSREGNIPHALVRTRDSLARELGMSPEELPFAGELVRVRDEWKNWEGAIERVLWNFARSILVPKERYKDFVELVDNKNMRSRLVFHMAENVWDSQSIKVGENHLFNAVQIKPGTRYYNWLEKTIKEQYDYALSGTVEEFMYERRALSMNGQVKRKGSNNVKDDSVSIADPASRALGWNNTDKILALQKREVEIGDSILEIKNEIRGLNKDVRSLGEKIFRLGELEGMDWSEVETASIFERTRGHEELLAKLDGGDDVAIIEKERLAKEKAIADSQSRLADALAERRSAQIELERTIKLLERSQEIEAECEASLPTLPSRGDGAPADPLLRLKQLDRKGWVAKATLENIEEGEAALRSHIESLVDEVSDELKVVETDLIAGLQRLRYEFPDNWGDKMASLSELDECEDRYEELKEDLIDRYRLFYKNLLHHDVKNKARDLLLLIDNEKESVISQCSRVNVTLRGIDYHAGSFLELVPQEVDDVEIKNFVNELKEALDGRHDYEPLMSPLDSYNGRGGEDLGGSAQAGQGAGAGANAGQVAGNSSGAPSEGGNTLEEMGSGVDASAKEEAAHEAQREFLLANLEEREKAVRKTDLVDESLHEALRLAFLPLRKDPMAGEAIRRWKRKITDVRNWFSFKINEIDKETEKVLRSSEDRDPRSRVRREKYAWTLVAAAMSYSFGLSMGGFASENLHFLILDRSLSKSMDESAEYALRLFKQFNLQFLAITPLHEIHVIEPFVSKMGYVSHGRNVSRIRNLNVTEYRSTKEREADLDVREMKAQNFREEDALIGNYKGSSDDLEELNEASEEVTKISSFIPVKEKEAQEGLVDATHGAGSTGAGVAGAPGRPIGAAAPAATAASEPDMDEITPVDTMDDLAGIDDLDSQDEVVGIMTDFGSLDDGPFDDVDSLHGVEDDLPVPAASDPMAPMTQIENPMADGANVSSGLADEDGDILKEHELPHVAPIDDEIDQSIDDQGEHDDEDVNERMRRNLDLARSDYVEDEGRMDPAIQEITKAAPSPMSPGDSQNPYQGAHSLPVSDIHPFEPTMDPYQGRPEGATAPMTPLENPETGRYTTNPEAGMEGIASPAGGQRGAEGLDGTGGAESLVTSQAASQADSHAQGGDLADMFEEMMRSNSDPAKLEGSVDWKGGNGADNDTSDYRKTGLFKFEMEEFNTPEPHLSNPQVLREQMRAKAQAQVHMRQAELAQERARFRAQEKAKKAEMDLAKMFEDMMRSNSDEASLEGSDDWMVGSGSQDTSDYRKTGLFKFEMEEFNKPAPYLDRPDLQKEGKAPASDLSGMFDEMIRANGGNAQAVEAELPQHGEEDTSEFRSTGLFKSDLMESGQWDSIRSNLESLEKFHHEEVATAQGAAESQEKTETSGQAGSDDDFDLAKMFDDMMAGGEKAAAESRAEGADATGAQATEGEASRKGGRHEGEHSPFTDGTYEMDTGTHLPKDASGIEVHGLFKSDLVESGEWDRRAELQKEYQEESIKKADDFDLKRIWMETLGEEYDEERDGIKPEDGISPRIKAFSESAKEAAASGEHKEMIRKKHEHLDLAKMFDAMMGEGDWTDEDFIKKDDDEDVESSAEGKEDVKGQDEAEAKSSADTALKEDKSSPSEEGESTEDKAASEDSTKDSDSLFDEEGDKEAEGPDLAKMFDAMMGDDVDELDELLKEGEEKLAIQKSREDASVFETMESSDGDEDGKKETSKEAQADKEKSKQSDAAKSSEAKDGEKKESKDKSKELDLAKMFDMMMGEDEGEEEKDELDMLLEGADKDESKETKVAEPSEPKHGETKEDGVCPADLKEANASKSKDGKKEELDLAKMFDMMMGEDGESSDEDKDSKEGKKPDDGDDVSFL